MEARYFNKIIFDEKRCRIRKTSSHKKALINEINWYIKMPKTIKYCHPTIYEFDLNKDHPYVELEFCKGISFLKKLSIWKFVIFHGKNI